MSVRRLFASILAASFACCLATSICVAQVHDPAIGSRATTPIVEPTAPSSSPSLLAAKLWARLADWSSKRSSENRWRELYARPVVAPPAQNRVGR